MEGLGAPLWGNVILAKFYGVDRTLLWKFYLAISALPLKFGSIGGVFFRTRREVTIRLNLFWRILIFVSCAAL